MKHKDKTIKSYKIEVVRKNTQKRELTYVNL